MDTLDEKMGILVLQNRRIENVLDRYEKRFEKVEHTLEIVEDETDRLIKRVDDIQEVLPQKEKFAWKIPPAFGIAERRWKYYTSLDEEKRKAGK